MKATVTLYRPTGPAELALVEASGHRRWPPRLPDQPIFYPVTNEAYAVEIARDWNVPASGAGFVTRFEVCKTFMERYAIKQVGAAHHTEWWVPAEDLQALNDHIVGAIEVTQRFPENGHAVRRGAERTSSRADTAATTLNLLTVADLLHAVSNGVTPKYLLFWGHQPSADGAIGKNCFSQWFGADFEFDGQRYPTAEHFMMAEKARLFCDTQTRSRILAARTPAEAKKLGRGVRGFDEAVWEAARFDIVVRANHAKFAQNPALRGYLLATGNRVLVEASPMDRIWGIGLAANDPRALDPTAWCGLNLLGFALMQVRARLA